VAAPFALACIFTSASFTGLMAFPVSKKARTFSSASRYARFHATSVIPPICGCIITRSLRMKYGLFSRQFRSMQWHNKDSLDFRFSLEHVEASPADLARLERFYQCLLIREWTSTCVDEEHAIFHLRELLV
jgi:hypothetical protein